VCDGLTDLLAQMNLQSSVASNPDVPLPPPTATVALEQSPETIGLDAPVPQTQHSTDLEPGEDRSPSGSEESDSSHLPCSTSVSTIIDRLHLSDIDWDGSSFTSSPPVSPAPHVSAPAPRVAPGKACGVGVEKNLPAGGVVPASGRVGSGPAQEVCYTEGSLRERLLLRNMANMAISNKTNEDTVPKRLLYPAPNQGPLRGGLVPVNTATSTQLSDKRHAVEGNKTSECGQSGADKAYRDRPVSKRDVPPSARVHSKAQDGRSGARKPQAPSESLRAVLASVSLIPHRCRSAPIAQGNGDRKPVPQGAKRSVCTAVGSSSEDSGAENRPTGVQRKAKSKPLRHVKLRPASKATAAPKTAADTAPITCSSGPRAQSVPGPTAPSVPGPTAQSVPGPTARSVPGPGAISDEFLGDGLPQGSLHNDVFIACAPSSPVSVVDSDDSLSCSDSPLPLAERVRLKYLM